MRPVLNQEDAVGPQAAVDLSDLPDRDPVVEQRPASPEVGQAQRSDPFEVGQVDNGAGEAAHLVEAGLPVGLHGVSGGLRQRLIRGLGSRAEPASCDVAQAVADLGSRPDERGQPPLLGHVPPHHQVIQGPAGVVAHGPRVHAVIAWSWLDPGTQSPGSQAWIPSSWRRRDQLSLSTTNAIFTLTWYSLISPSSTTAVEWSTSTPVIP